MEMYTDTTASILYEAEVGRKGSMWIVGRSLLIHENVDGAPRWSCANIGTAGAGAQASFHGGEVEGFIELYQPDPGYLYYSYALTTTPPSIYRTSITASLTGLEPAPGNKWHIHVDPVPNHGACDRTGGHYDPLTADTMPPRGDYEIGDLSGKWGRLNGAADDGETPSFVGTSQGYVLDGELPLYGNYSVLNRSIVIHKVDSSRWVCATTLIDANTPIIPPPPPTLPPPSPPPLPFPDTASATVAFTLEGLGSGAAADVDAFIASVKADLVSEMRRTGGDTYNVPVERIVVQVGAVDDAAGTAAVVVTVFDEENATGATVDSSSFVDKVLAEASSDSGLTFPTLQATAAAVVAPPSAPSAPPPSAPPSDFPVAVVAAVVIVMVLLCVLVGLLVLRHRRQSGGKRSVMMVDERAKSTTRAKGQTGGGYQMAVKDHTALKANQA